MLTVFILLMTTDTKRTLSVDIKYICMSFRNRKKSETPENLSFCFKKRWALETGRKVRLLKTCLSVSRRDEL